MIRWYQVRHACLQCQTQLVIVGRWQIEWWANCPMCGNVVHLMFGVN